MPGTIALERKPGCVDRKYKPTRSTNLRSSCSHDQFPVFYTSCADEFISNLFNQGAFSPHDDYFQTVVMVKMDVSG
jgi:hypothetical protein